MKKKYFAHMGFPGKCADIGVYVQAENEYEAVRAAEKQYPKKEVKTIREC